MSAHVLVAEDNEMQAEVIRRYLEQDGHSVTLVRDGRRALDETRRLQPDLVVLDVMMPEVDGLEVCRVLRHESDVLVLMLTARSTEDDLLKGLADWIPAWVISPLGGSGRSARLWPWERRRTQPRWFGWRVDRLSRGGGKR